MGGYFEVLGNFLHPVFQFLYKSTALPCPVCERKIFFEWLILRISARVHQLRYK